jgi:hypothetical protein
MDPYLEDPALWPGFHHLLIAASVEQLQPQLRPRNYYVNIEERVWLLESERSVYPDMAVIDRGRATREPTASTAVLEPDAPVVIHALEEEFHEAYLEIYDSQGHRLVTSIEFLSPANKSEGPGRDLYRRKQEEVAAAGVNLVEIDLLRGGLHAVKAPRHLLEKLRPWHYLVSIWRPGKLDYEVYPIGLRCRLPRIRVPLRAGDADGVLDVQAAFARAYDTGPYPERLNYAASPPWPLAGDDQRWAEEVLRAGSGQ